MQLQKSQTTEVKIRTAWQSLLPQCHWASHRTPCITSKVWQSVPVWKWSRLPQCPFFSINKFFLCSILRLSSKLLEKLFLFVRNPTRRRSTRPVCCCSSEVCVWEQWIFSSFFLENKGRGNTPNIRLGRCQTSLEHDSFITATMWQLWIQRVAFRGFVLTEAQDVCVWGR